MVKHVAVFGGTHGNEYTGVYLIKTMSKKKLDYSFKTSFVLSNKKAFEENKRFIDEDLNRCFSIDDLENRKLTSLESKLAKDINAKFGKDGTTPADFIIDLHTTTSNMGATIVINKSCELTQKAAYYLSTKFDKVKLILDKTRNDESNFLMRIAESGMVVEVGPVPQGVLNPHIYNDTENILNELLKFLEENIELDFSKEVDAYEIFEYIDLPSNSSGELMGMVSSELQDKDFQAISKGQELVTLFDGESIRYTGEEAAFPIFINEAAYYEKKLAMMLTRKVQFKVGDI